MKEIRTEVLIKADPGRVWSRFTDFKTYPEWNPFIKSVAGDVRVGNNISITLSPPDAKRMKFKPRVLKLEPNRELRWLGRLFFPGLFDGEHIFELIDHKNGTTTFIQRERFRGMLVPFLKKMLDDNTKRGFESMNEALKARCE